MINNTLTTTTKKTKEQVASFEVNGMEVQLTPTIVRDYLVSGNKENVTNQEIAMFINLCKFSRLNPWVKEAYCIKYGNAPATIVVGKEAFLKRAEQNKNFDGYVAGIVVINKNGDIEYRNGSIQLDGEEIVGGFAEVFRKDRSHPTRIEVSFKEFAGYKKDGTLNANWSEKPATMIKKVALVQALRESFPSSFGGMYTAEEQGIEEQISPLNSVMNSDGTIPSPKHENAENEPLQAYTEVSDDKSEQTSIDSYLFD